MNDIASLQALLQPLFPGLLGMELSEAKGARTTTIESKTNFFAAAPQDTVVTAECTPFHKGKSTMVWQTQIRNEAGKLAAVVTQTQMVLPA